MKSFFSVIAVWLTATSFVHSEIFFDLESGAVWSDKADVRIPSDRGTRFSLVNDLGADEPSAFFRGRLTWRPSAKHDFSLLYAPLEVEYSGSFDKQVNFNGFTFLPNTPTEGKFRFDSYRITYRYNFIQKESFQLGIGLTAKIRDAEVSLKQNSRTVTDKNTGLVPLINFQLQWCFAQELSLLLEGDALGAPQGYAVDVTTALQWHATENLALRLGYRILDGGADNDNVYVFSRFHYATVGLNYRF